jgi:protein SCO1/2
MKEKDPMRHEIPLVHGNSRRAVAALAIAFLLGITVSAKGEEHGTKAGKATKSCCAPAAADTAPQAKSTYRRSVEEISIPDLTLVRMDGRKVALRDELPADLPVMLNFIFTTCTTICPVMSATFSQVQAGLGEERDGVRMISISIDPEQDTPSRLRDYAQRHRASDGWHFLTGSVEQIGAVQRAFDAYRGSKFNHAPLTFLRAAGNSHWVRMEGLVPANVLLEEYARLGHEHGHSEPETGGD